MAGHDMADCKRTYRGNYRRPDWDIADVELQFELDGHATQVTAELSITKAGTEKDLVLDGRNLDLRFIALDGTELTPSQYAVDSEHLTLYDAPSHFRLTIKTLLKPTDNPGLEGLNYKDGVYFTHCEPEGFRRITYFLDRPDVLARYRCKIIASMQTCPVLLSNGNLIEQGIVGEGRHFAIWEDPFPKASYLFALVAGKFEKRAGSFVTRSGRVVQIGIYASAADIADTVFGLETIKAAMAWDERAYNREYDLDLLNVAVIRSYPGGAMENKGLNIYTSEAFLAAPSRTLDDSRRHVQAIIAHEYFHNWTGNRVGCRDWFELSLKEGFTIFRQREFMASVFGEAVTRIDDVSRLREYQFPEDDGGNAHAVRPSSYLTVNNFYTSTIYEKGSELIRALKVIVGESDFRAGVELYFNRYDGTATTINSLIDSIAEASGKDLTQFAGWYEVVGAVFLRYQAQYQAGDRTLKLTIEQSRADGKLEPLHIPVQIGLLSRAGEEIPSQVVEGPGQTTQDCVLQVRENKQTFAFENIPEQPVISFLRGYSAPVRLASAPSDEELQVLALHDCDPLNRWDAIQMLAVRAVVADVVQSGDESRLAWFDVMAKLLERAEKDLAFTGRALALPSVRVIAEMLPGRDLDDVLFARARLSEEAGEIFRKTFEALRANMGPFLDAPSGWDARRVANTCLYYMTRLPRQTDLALCRDQLQNGPSFEQKVAALKLLILAGGTNRSRALKASYEEWHRRPSQLDQWFAIQAGSESEDAVMLVESIVGHRDFDLSNGTRVKMTFDAFSANLGALHHRSGRGYKVIVNLAKALNRPNPRLGARFVKRLDGWRSLDSRRQAMVSEALRTLLSEPDLAPDILEVAERSLSLTPDETKQRPYF